VIRVLLVEDDPMVAELNRLYVDRVEGFGTVGAVATAAEALERLDSKAVDLILLDIFMPGQNGLDLLTEIRARALEVDVIFVSAARDMRTINRALSLGAMDYLIKPFEFERLRQALEHYREKRNVMGSGEPVSQRRLDRLILRRTAAPGQIRIPKGLDAATLKRVAKGIQGFGEPESWFTCEDLAGRVGLSRVSVRKYVEFLCGLRVLRMEPGYGSVGRPVHRYLLQKPHLRELDPFLQEP
jgi:CitB family two-component system response regulator MalR